MAYTNIFLDATAGNDSNDGLSAGAPKLTISAALTACSDGTNGNRLNIQKDTSVAWGPTPLSLPRTPSNTAPVLIQPYNTAAGDWTSSRVTITLPAASEAWSAAYTDIQLRHIHFDGNGNTATTGMSLGTRLEVYDCKFSNRPANSNYMLNQAVASSVSILKFIEVDDVRCFMLAQGFTDIDYLQYYFDGTCVNNGTNILFANAAGSSSVTKCVYWVGNSGDNTTRVFATGNYGSLTLRHCSGYIGSTAGVHIDGAADRWGSVDSCIFEGGATGIANDSGGRGNVTNSAFRSVTTPIDDGEGGYERNNSLALSASPFADAAGAAFVTLLESMEVSSGELPANVPTEFNYDAGAIQTASGAGSGGGGGDTIASRQAIIGGFSQQGVSFF